MKKRFTCFIPLLFLLNVIAFAQTRAITGKVTDAKDGSELPGVSIVVQEIPGLGTQTNASGSYSLSVPANAKNLVFRYISYQQKTVSITSTVINVKLESEQKQLSEVVVVGYGTQIRQNLTGSVAKVNSREIENQPVQSFESAIQGKAAGVVVSSGSGKVGQGIAIRVRGSSSVTAGNQPLYVVDGIPITSVSVGDAVNFDPSNPLADINPNDIESIEVLKDASASAIYGSRASNGVILITTKKGKSGKTVFTLDYFTGISKPAVKRDFLNSQQYVELFEEAAVNGGKYDFANDIENFGPAANEQEAIDAYTQYLEDNFDAFSAGTDWRNAVVNTNWQDEQFRSSAGNSQYEISATGGNEKTRFFTSGAYSNQEGILIQNAFKRISGRLNLDHSATDKLSLGVNLNLARSRNDRVANDNSFSTPGQLVALPPIQPVIDPSTNELSTTGPYYNGLIEARDAYFKTIVYRNISNAYASYKILPALNLRTEFGVDVLNQSEDGFQGRQTQGNPTGNGNYRTVTSLNYTSNTFLSYNTKFGEKHNLEAVGGFSYQKQDVKTSQVVGEGFPSDDFKNLASASDITFGSSFGTDEALVSYFARANYRFTDKYLVALSARYDGSSKFGANNRYGFFPAISAGWIISKEKFLSGAEWLSFLKLRAGYGYTGNSSILDFQSLALFGSSVYPNMPGYTPTQVENPDLKWEKTGSFDAGLEFGFFNNRLSGDFSYYNKQTKDLLLNVNVPATSGFATVLKNVGSLENKGLELTLNSQNFVGAFKWSTNFNISFNRNKVKDLDGQVILGTGRAPQRAIEGQPIGVFFTAKYAGVDPQNGDALYYLQDGTTTNDYNSAFRQVVGDSNPDFTGGFTNNFSYKNFDFNIFFQFVSGNDIYNGAGIYQSVNADFFDNQTSDQLNRWQKPGDITNVPQARFLQSNGTRTSSRWLSDGSYLRLKSASLGYTIPGRMVKNFFSSARVYVSGFNLLTFTNYNNGDPEVNTTTISNIDNGVDFYTAPQARTITFGVNLKF
ncbi:SusC/RagA family TonB-linked outer membrane protein [Pedobacter sp. HMF7647]|uniref:SusC/RagA family TonB-linked outer membrane protein n=1 Tax=Hufsiella arboris TaxID=2695275 RepID=A0A7K1Y9M2_9SPHI|nr:TonB-dependent receptor [Hufsiella arboris]MXV51293.1 SusC/RagA family TonB-linked outer membrane protein [Hufsiella arboris]